jgi:hypothetical protein
MKERWDKAPPTSGNVYDSNPEVDPVLWSPLSSFQCKANLITEIKASSQFLMLGRDSELVFFHRNSVEDLVKVARKALANVELIITNDCRYKMITIGQNKRQSRKLCEGLLVGSTSSMIEALQGPLKCRLQHSRPLRLHLLRRQLPPLHRRTFIEKRAAIFYDRLDGQLTNGEKTGHLLRRELQSSTTDWMGS